MNICLSRWCFMALISLFYLSKLRFLHRKLICLAAGGRGGVNSGGGGVSGELTNWDGTKKKTG